MDYVAQWLKVQVQLQWKCFDWLSSQEVYEEMQEGEGLGILSLKESITSHHNMTPPDHSRPKVLSIRGLF